MHQIHRAEFLVRVREAPEFSTTEIRLDVVRDDKDVKHLEIRFNPYTRMMSDGVRIMNPSVILAMIQERSERMWKVRVTGTISTYRPVNGYSNAFVQSKNGVQQWFFKIKAEEIEFLD